MEDEEYDDENGDENGVTYELDLIVFRFIEKSHLNELQEEEIRRFGRKAVVTNRDICRNDEHYWYVCRWKGWPLKYATLQSYYDLTGCRGAINDLKDRIYFNETGLQENQQCLARQFARREFHKGKLFVMG